MGVRVHTNSCQSIQTTNLPYPFPTYPPPIPTISPNSILDHDNFIILNQQHKNSNNLCRKLNIVEFQSFEVNKSIFSINSLNSFVHTKKYKEIYKKNFKGERLLSPLCYLAFLVTKRTLENLCALPQFCNVSISTSKPTT